MIRAVAHFDGRPDFSWHDVLELAQKKPQLFTANVKFLEMRATMVKGQNFMTCRACDRGNMLLSKRAEMFLQSIDLLFSREGLSCGIF